MNQSRNPIPHRLNLSRRDWMKQCSAASLAGLGTFGLNPKPAQAAKHDKALIAISLDLEMSRNFPKRDDLHWDYEKGNLNEPTKEYSVEAARRVKAAGGVLHFFSVCRVFEQENIDWAKELVKEGHPIGNHTYDHINLTAKKPEDLQFRFKRSPWLIEGKSINEVIHENIRIAELAMQQRLGYSPDGFRTPGGFRNGLREFPEVRSILKDLGYNWVSSLYPHHEYTEPFQKPSWKIIDSIIAAHEESQPFIYDDGLVEIPMSPISDIGAFRTCRWKLDWFLDAIRESVNWAIEHRAVFDFLAHPSCMYVVDPDFKAIELICDMVNKAGDRAAIVDLGIIAETQRQD